MDTYQEKTSPELITRKYTVYYVVAAFIVAIVAIVVIFVGFYVVQNKALLPETDNSAVGGIKDSDRGIPIEKDAQFNISGSLHLTLLPKNESKLVNTYTYDINSAEFKSIQLAQGLNMTTKVSPNGDRLAFARYGGDEVMHIFVTDQERKDFKRISKNKLSFKREPTWSPDGSSIAYVAFEEDGSDAHDPEGWQVYVADTRSGDTKKDERLITRGYNPIFSPDGNSLLLIKNEGLYLYDLTQNKEPEKVWGVLGGEDSGSHMHSHMKLSLSHDAKTLAWSDHHKLPNGGLTLFSITSWSPFSIEVKKQIDNYIIYNIFSPDDKYLAVQVADEALDGQLINGRVLVYNLDTFDFKNILDLRGFNVDFMWLTDWR
ncbi:PD40 domain-containing protein [Candidatus Kaiserbacteria bacterium]|nr:PD40 domain-containing protein [Candidatus Kaiserbacteria bacterium]